MHVHTVSLYPPSARFGYDATPRSQSAGSESQVRSQQQAETNALGGSVRRSPYPIDHAALQLGHFLRLSGMLLPGDVRGIRVRPLSSQPVIEILIKPGLKPYANLINALDEVRANRQFQNLSAAHRVSLQQERTPFEHNPLTREFRFLGHRVLVTEVAKDTRQPPPLSKWDRYFLPSLQNRLGEIRVQQTTRSRLPGPPLRVPSFIAEPVSGKPSRAPERPFYALAV